MSQELRYNPIQSRADHQLPEASDFPPVTERVPQDPDPYAPIAELSIRRVTHQGNELCNLKCPGCYLGEWLKKDGEVRAGNEQRRTSVAAFGQHLEGLGEQLEEVYLLGAETTMTPQDTKAMIELARERGLGVMAVTNAVTREAVVDATFKEALEQGEMHKLNISIDSIDSQVHDVLRGRQGACESTLETIHRYVEAGYPVKAMITVWPYNYHTILETVTTLYKDYGVRGFAFHCGSLEGVREEQRQLLGGHVHPEAWRALTAQLQAFNLEHFEELKHFNFPYIYVTQQELDDYVINDGSLSEQYSMHTEALEQGHVEPLPFNACVGIGVPQVYMYGNDKTAVGTGRLSACNVDSAAHSRHLAEFDDTTGTYQTTTENNQLAGMIASPNLCPAVHEATGNLHPSASDRVVTESGALHHICRYISNNQMPAGHTEFPRELYEHYAAEYQARFS